MKRTEIVVGLFTLGLCLSTPAIAWAGEDITRGQAVANRMRPEFDPPGIGLGGFRLYPQLNLRESFSDNIFATETDRASDFITTINPALDLRSDWNNHSLNLHADLASSFYADHSSQNYTNYNLLGDGTVDVTRDLQLFGGLGYSQLHEDRASPDNQGGLEPTLYNLLTATAGGRAQLNHIGLTQQTVFNRYTFEDVPAVGGGTIINTDRDRNEVETSLKLGYEFQPQRTVFVRGAYNWRMYDNVPDINGFNRDSNGYRLDVGASYDLTGILFAELYAGYMAQNYDDPAFQPIDGVNAGATLIWNVTRLTTITGGLARRIGETTVPGAPGYIALDATLRVDHELLRNLLVNAEVGYSNFSYGGVDRDDNMYMAGFGAEYRLNRYLSLSGGYAYRTRESNAVGGSFDENAVFLQIGSHL